MEGKKKQKIEKNRLEMGEERKWRPRSQNGAKSGRNGQKSSWKMRKNGEMRKRWKIGEENGAEMGNLGREPRGQNENSGKWRKMEEKLRKNDENCGKMRKIEENEEELRKK